MPLRTGAPCTSTIRAGRWRSFPYLGEFDEGTFLLWQYLCNEWNYFHEEENKRLLRFNFFMLQADVLPNIHFTSTRKRLIYSHVCENSSIQENVQQSEEEEEKEL